MEFFAALSVIPDSSITPFHRHIALDALAGIEKGIIGKKLILVTICFTRVTSEYEHQRVICWRRNTAVPLSTELIMELPAIVFPTYL
jgi:hypothetical protein